MSRKNKQRNARGAGLVAGTTAVAVIIGTGAMATLLLVNLGSGILFEEKLGRINSLATNFASAHAQDTNLQAETESYVKNLMPAMGLAPIGTSVTVTPTDTQNGPGVQVTLGNQFHLVGLRGVLPSQITLRDTETASDRRND